MSRNRDTMFDELCDKCGKSLFLIHPDDQFNCMCTPASACPPVFVFDDEEDPEAIHSTTQLKDIPVGGSFYFRGEKFTKRNHMGWGLGVGNITNAKGETSHLHPTTTVNLIH
jgi:hypothetical protein